MHTDDFAHAPRFGIAGNMAGHLEQAGEAGDFTQVRADAGKPKGMFPTYIPGHAGFLGINPVSATRLRLPPGPEAGMVQAEPELALFTELEWVEGRVARVRPVAFTAYNDASIRKPAPKISVKKNWGADTKGFASEIVPIDTLSVGGPLDRYRLVSFLIRDGVLHDYGEDSPLPGYGLFHDELLEWIADRLNTQADHGPLEHLAGLLTDQPTRAVFGVGATTYTALGADDRLRPGDEIIIAVYDAAAISLAGVRERAASGAPLPAGSPLLRQRVEAG